MEAYPLIYSRTKNCDYVSGFLVRPEDLEYDTASKYVSAALNELNHSGGMRHTVFPVGNYIVYGGTACITANIISAILNEKNITELDFDYQNYQTDAAGRPITFFIGFAIKKSDVGTGETPNIDLYTTYKIYLEYLKKQWSNSSIKTELLTDGIEISSSMYKQNFTPDTVNFNGMKILKNYNETLYNDVINYYFHQCAMGYNDSFLSNILSEIISDNLCFKNISLYNKSAEEFLRTYSDNLVKEKNAVKESKLSDEPTVIHGIGNVSGTSPVTQQNQTSNVQGVRYTAKDSSIENNTGKKTIPIGRILAAIIVGLLVGIILIIVFSSQANAAEIPKDKLEITRFPKENQNPFSMEFLAETTPDKNQFVEETVDFVRKVTETSQEDNLNSISLTKEVADILKKAPGIYRNSSPRNQKLAEKTADFLEEATRDSLNSDKLNKTEASYIPSMESPSPQIITSVIPPSKASQAMENAANVLQKAVKKS